MHKRAVRATAAREGCVLDRFPTQRAALFELLSAAGRLPNNSSQCLCQVPLRCQVPWRKLRFRRSIASSSRTTRPPLSAAHRTWREAVRAITKW